jgi:phosphoglycerate dehydrogenase-like enzyme
METSPSVVVTFRASEDIRRAIAAVLDGAASAVFPSDLGPEERGAALAGAEALLAWNLDTELHPEEFERLGTIGLIQFVSAGADHIPFDRLPEGVLVASNVGAYAGPMAEHVLALALALAKRLSQQHAKLARGEFDQDTPTKAIHGSVLGIIGFGGTGQACATLFEALGARIHAINRSGRTDRQVEFVGTLADLGRVLEAADVLVLSIPLTRETRGLIGRRQLALMKPDAILVNVARGAIVDEAALYEHLRDHPEFSAGIDAWWDEPHGKERFETNYPFFELPNVLGSPHNSALTPGAMVAANRHAAANVLRHLRGEPVAGLVRREDYVD